MTAATSEDVSWPELHRVRRAIVVVDVVESVRLMQANEADVIDRWRRFVAEVRTQVLPKHGGRMVKSLGDGMLLEFETVPTAVAAAFDIQRAVAHYNDGYEPDAQIWLRAGGHVGDVTEDELDVYGPAVNLAARIATLAGPGQIAVSVEARDELASDVDAVLEDLGNCYFKHLVEPVRCFLVGPPSALLALAPPIPAADQKTLNARIAVLPLECRGLGPAHAFAGELIADSVIARLAVSPSLRVLSRLSTSVLASRRLTVAEIAAQLDVAYVLDGSMTSVGPRWRCTMELVDSRSAEIVWSQTTDIAPDTVLQIDDDFTAEVAAQIFAAIATHQLRRVRTQPLPTLEAFALQLSGLALIHRAAPPEFVRGRDVLEALVDRHPRAPNTRAWLAKWWVLRTTRGLGGVARDEAMHALGHTRAALQADPECALALAVQGFAQCHMLGDLDAAENSLALALQLNPNEPLAWLYRAVVFAFKGQGRQAFEHAERAIALSPLDPQRPYFDALAASSAITAGYLPRGIELANRALRANRNHLPTLRALTAALAESNDLDGARAAAARVLELAPEFSIKAYLASGPKGSEETRQRFAQAFAKAGLPNG